MSTNIDGERTIPNEICDLLRALRPSSKYPALYAPLPLHGRPSPSLGAYTRTNQTFPHKSSTGAEMVSRHCQNAGDWEGAIEFLLMAKRTGDAFSLAKSHAQMDVFTKVLYSDGPSNSKM